MAGLMATLAAGLAGCGSGAGVPTAFSPQAAGGPSVVAGHVSHQRPVVSNRSVAALDLAQLMRVLDLPKGSTKLTSERPKNSPAGLGYPAVEPDSRYVVLITRYAMVEKPPAAVFAWLVAHRPAGTTEGVSGPSLAVGTAQYFESYVWPKTSILDERWLLISPVAFGDDGSLVRIDAWVTYLPNRPVTETLPAHVDRVDVAVTLTATRRRVFTITKPSAIALLEKAIDALQRPNITSNPGGPDLAGPAVGQYLVARFFVGTDTVPAVTLSDSPILAEMNVGNVHFLLGHRLEPILEDLHWLVAKAVERITGIDLAAGPR
jgi:hypothetical protein